MKNFSVRRPALLICAAAIIFSLLTFAIPASAAAQEVKPVSLGLYVIAEKCHMAKAALSGNIIKFSADDFARAMNLSSVDSVTVTKLPPITDGELRVGSTVITGEHTLKSSDISLLTYVPGAAGITTSSFEFRVNGSPVDITCMLYHLDKVNQCPTLSNATENYLNVSTHENITLYGTLPCYDPDGDETVIEIVSYPETGILTLIDSATGEYTFTPKSGYSGKDEFTYVARDKYGNYSASKTVTLTVSKMRSSLSYADMENAPAYNAAITMTEKGIMSGRAVGGELYFDPDGYVSRQQFVVMAMNTLGMREVSNVDKTVFADDGDISESMRDYIGVAYELGYIKGELDSDGRLCFFPEREISRAEAACILASMINAPTPTITPSFSDSSSIPTWAAPSIFSLNYLGILRPVGGNISPMSPLTRADAALILATLV